MWASIIPGITVLLLASTILESPGLTKPSAIYVILHPSMRIVLSLFGGEPVPSIRVPHMIADIFPVSIMNNPVIKQVKGFDFSYGEYPGSITRVSS
jgi:hypothetical protein